MTSRPLSSEGPFGRFADRLLSVELPDLPPTARTETVEFVCRRADAIPTPLRLAVASAAIGSGVLTRLVGLDRTTSILRSTRLPFVGELARMVRSLGFTYVWETWPPTKPSGAPGDGS